MRPLTTHRPIWTSIRLNLVISLAIGLVACGGGGESATRPLSADARQGAATGAEVELPQALTIVSLTKISEVRVGRTTFDYTFQVAIRNDGQARADILARLTAAGQGTTIVDGEVRAGVLEAGATVVAEDTIKLRHDRAYPFSLPALQWDIQSLRAIVIRGIVTDDPVAGAKVTVTSLANQALLATVVTDKDGAYVTPLLAQSSLSSGYLLTASGGTSRGEPFTGTLKAAYLSPADYAASHVTLLTSIVVEAAEASATSPADLAVTVDSVASKAIARGLLLPDWKTLNVATSFATAESTAIRTVGLDEYVSEHAWRLGYDPRITSSETACRDELKPPRRVCTARIGALGGQIVDPPGLGVGNVRLSAGPPKDGCVVDANVSIHKGGHFMQVWYALASGDANSSECVNRYGFNVPVFDDPVEITLPLENTTSLRDVGGSCASEAHPVMPVCVSDIAQANRAPIAPAVFVDDGQVHRVGRFAAHRSASRSVSMTRSFGSTLRGTSTLNLFRENSAAVLFVHGFKGGEGFGGGAGTWGELPRLVQALKVPTGAGGPNRFEPYEFQWRTDASFYEVAQDLAAAITHVHAITGRKVHIVAHSFGGILARTVLQRIAGRAADVDWSLKVASLTTVGTPHSGIKSADGEVDGVLLPDGWVLPTADIPLLKAGCYQITCYEAGLDAGIADWAKTSLQIAGLVPQPGYVTAKLRQSIIDGTGELPSALKFQVLIGQQTFARPDGAVVYQDGDRLITYAGQRLTPAPSGSSGPLLFEAMIGSAIVTERVLGLNVGVSGRPGSSLIASDASPYFLAPFGRGYKHFAALALGGLISEVDVPSDCSDSITCAHDTWVNVRELLLSLNGGAPSPNFPKSTGGSPPAVSGASCKAPVVGSPMVCTLLGSLLPESVSFTATNCTPAPMAVLPGGDGSQRQFSCTPLTVGLPVEVSYGVPGFIGPLPAVPVVLAALPTVSSFMATGSMREARVGHTATRLADGRVLITGGDNSANKAPYLRSAEVYDPNTGAFSSTRDMLSRRGGHTATLLRNGKVLITGGFSEYVTDRTLSSAELFDPTTGGFEATESMRIKRAWHTATLLDDGRVLIAGGFDNQVPVFGTYLRSAEIFDPGSGQFSQAGDMTIPRIWFAATKLVDGTVLVAGGSDGYDKWTGAAESFNPDTMAFTAAGSLATPRWITQSALMDDGRVLFPGGNVLRDVRTKSTEIYSPAARSFLRTGDLTMARAGASVTSLTDGRVLVAGGGNGPAVFDSAELYSPQTGEFGAVPDPLVSPRSGHTATMLTDGKVLLVGGAGAAGQALASAELYMGELVGEAYAYTYKAHDFGVDTAGNTWNIWAANGSNIWAFRHSYVGGFLSYSFKVQNYAGYYCSASCRLHVIFDKNPSAGFNASNVLKAAPVPFPENNQNNHVYIIRIQWGALGYRVIVYDETASTEVSNTHYPITSPTGMFFDSFSSYYNWPGYYYSSPLYVQIDDASFISSYSANVYGAEVSGTNGGGLLMSTTPRSSVLSKLN